MEPVLVLELMVQNLGFDPLPVFVKVDELSLNVLSELLVKLRVLDASCLDLVLFFYC